MMFIELVFFAGGFLLGCIFPSDTIREKVRSKWGRKESIPDEEPLRMNRMMINPRQNYGQV